MARIDLDLSGLQAARQEMAALTASQRTLDAAVASAQAALDGALRGGVSPNVVAPLRQRVQQAESSRSELIAQQRAAQSRIDALAGGLLLQRDPASMVQALDARHPIALLPMRLETRYVPVGAPTSLRIRVYPDDLNTIEHVPALTPDEQHAGVDYWTARFAHQDDEASRILRDLATVFGRGRAAWIVRVLTPDNPVPGAGEEAAPLFPPTDTIDSRAKATRAVLLPDRWCAIGYAAGRREVFRVWGNRIPDELLLSPDWLATDAPEALLGGDRAWMVDFDAAIAKGMAVEITQETITAIARSQHAVPFNLATGTLERLVVFGLEWTRTADQSVADLTDLLAAHRDSTGLAFAPLGTPTNNTEAAASGFSPADERTPPQPPETAGTDKDALQLLTWALGLAPDALPADNIANAHLAEQRTALHMMNVLWRGTFADYLLELWNPPLDEDARFLKTPALYATRGYAVSYVRATGALPLVRVGKQPYGILPVVGKRFVSSGSAVETAVGNLLAVLRPMWELASRSVPTMTDGSVDRAKDIVQTAAWSQTAYYRDKDAGKALCKIPNAFTDAQQSSRGGLIRTLLAAVGVTDYWLAHIYSCSDFLPDPPYSAGYLAGVPWVLADAKNPKLEAADAVTFSAANNYLAKMAAASIQSPAAAGPLLYANQSGPALLQALVSYSIQKEKGDAVEGFALSSVAVNQVVSLAATRMPYVEATLDNEAMFTVQTHKELANVSLASVTGKATLGEHVANTLTVPFEAKPASAYRAADMLSRSVDHIVAPTRNLAAVKLSLDYLAGRTVGELNIAFRSTLDCFSYRLDAWLAARANRRLEQMRDQNPGGVYVGGFAWVENLKADTRPDSEGYLLAPSLGQAASAAILRSGFMANHESGAFDIALDSHRTQRAVGILQGLTRDQPLAALYGYRFERGLRDAELGRFIWPFRLAFPWRPAGAAPTDESSEAIGARDVVDGVALLDAWESDSNAVRGRLAAALAHLEEPAPAADNAEWAQVATLVADVLDLADSVSDLLMAEGTHQIVQGNLDRAAAAMAVADKQSLPIETEFNRTLRGGAGYTQRLVALCPAPAAGWPDDRRARFEPAANAWLAAMLGDPARYRFAARVHRVDPQGHPVIDAGLAVVAWADLALSPLSAVLLAASVSAQHLSDTRETGFRSALVAAFTGALDDPATVVGLEIQQEADSPAALGLGHFEALAMTLKAVLDKARPVTRKDVVRTVDEIEATLPDEGEFPGVDRAELEARADTLVAEFDGAAAALVATAGADALLTALAAMDDFLPAIGWPAEVFAIDAAGADPGLRDQRAGAAKAALQQILEAKQNAVHADIPLLDGQGVPTHAQRVQTAIDRIKRLLGKDFPVMLRCSLGPYAAEFDASLAEQAALTQGDPWRIHGWLTQLARVREGAERFISGLSAHEALVGPGHAGDFKLVQFPHRPGQIWAALPEAWVEPDGTPFDPTQVPEELHDYLAQRPGAVYKDIHRVAPDLTIAFHAPAGLDALAADQTITGLVCDEWPEFVPDPYQTAAIGFHYDAPGARPPQSVLLALPPHLDQDAWTFEDLVDVIHEAFDLAKLRAVRPRDLAGGLGALLPGNYLPHAYTDDLPSVQVLKMLRDAQARMVSEIGSEAAHFILGKI
ncbi:MAG: hypothetical protein ACRD2I_20820 [Vicinamibacterales bacterium]